MAPILYTFRGSPAVQAVLVTAKAIGLNLGIRELNFEKREHLNPEFRKLNPQGTVPVLDDDGKIIADSYAINIYLVEKYGKDDSLYPKDLYQRALINQKLHFDSEVLHPLVKSVALKNTSVVRTELTEGINEAYAILEVFLAGNRWVTGNSVTIADFSLVASVRTLKIVAELDSKIYPNTVAWTKRAQALPCFAFGPPDLQENGEY